MGGIRLFTAIEKRGSESLGVRQKCRHQLYQEGRVGVSPRLRLSSWQGFVDGWFSVWKRLDLDVSSPSPIQFQPYGARLTEVDFPNRSLHAVSYLKDTAAMVLTGGVNLSPTTESVWNCSIRKMSSCPA